MGQPGWGGGAEEVVGEVGVEEGEVVVGAEGGMAVRLHRGSPLLSAGTQEVEQT